MLIGFTGRMGSGKSEALTQLKDFLDANGHRLSPQLVKFAQPLYDIQEFAYRRIASVYQRPDNFIKDRKLLQWMGTEWGRDSIRPTLWGDIWQIEVEKYLAQGYIVVCDDLRFDNEAERMLGMGGTIVEIRSTRTAERIDTNAGIKAHASEAGLDPKFDREVINNDGTLADYKNSLCALYRKLGLGNAKR